MSCNLQGAKLLQHAKVIAARRSSMRPQTGIHWSCWSNGLFYILIWEERLDRMTSRTAACNSAEGCFTSAKQRQSRGMKTDGQGEKWWQEEHRIRKLWHHQRTCVYLGHYQSLNEWCQAQKAQLQLSSSETAPPLASFSCTYGTRRFHQAIIVSALLINTLLLYSIWPTCILYND